MTTDRRLVIDTNLWISRLLAPGGVAARAVDHGLAWGVPLVSQATLAELTDVLSRPRFDRWVTRAERQQFLRRLGGVVRMVAITQRIHACRDPKDDKFLDVALTGEGEGYYAEYVRAPLPQLARCLTHGFAREGEPHLNAADRHAANPRRAATSTHTLCAAHSG